MPGTAGLAAINGAIEAMVRPLAAELAPLRVNAVSPGIIDTPWWDVMPADAKESYFRRAAETLPARRVGAAADVAEAIVMIARNPYVTGRSCKEVCVRGLTKPFSDLSSSAPS
jgi:NAD(P)-dependent dehydrogenase (short-subunit alcohol dehydrogenase family)